MEKQYNKKDINDLELTRITSNILSLNRKIVILPILAFLFSAIIFVIFSIFVFDKGLYAINLLSDLEIVGGSILLSAIILFIIYSIISFFFWFFNVALIISLNDILDSKELNIKESIIKTRKFIIPIIKWVLIGSILFIIEKIMYKYAKKKGKYLPFLVGVSLGRMSWRVATIFVMPIMIYEKLGVISSIKRSIGILKSNFKDMFWGRVGIGSISLVFFIYAIFIALFCTILLQYFFSMEIALKYGFVIGVILALGAFVYGLALKTSFILVMYRYATNKTLPIHLKKEFISML